MRVTDEKGCASQYTYDADNNLTRLRCEADGAYRQAHYTYDKDSREMVTKTGNISRSTVYDTWGRVSGQDWKKDSSAVFHVGYEYLDSGKNRVGLLKAVVNGTNRTEYAYDNNGNITSITAGGKTNTYVYDGLNQPRAWHKINCASCLSKFSCAALLSVVNARIDFFLRLAQKNLSFAICTIYFVPRP